MVVVQDLGGGQGFLGVEGGWWPAGGVQVAGAGVLGGVQRHVQAGCGRPGRGAWWWPLGLCAGSSVAVRRSAG